MFLLEDVIQKEVVPFTESIDSKQFLQEMVTAQYTGENLELAKALQESFDTDTLIELNEEDHQSLLEEVSLMEERLEDLKEICSINEAFRVSKKAKDLDGAIALALKESNAIAKEKGYKPVKSEADLSKIELVVAKIKTGMSMQSFIRSFTNITEYKTKTINNQLVVMDTGFTSVRAVKAVYTDSSGSKVKTLTVKFHKYLDIKGNMKK